MSSRTELSKLAAESLPSLMLKVGSGLSIFFMSIFVTRSLGAHEAGLFFLSLALVTILSALARVGFDQSVTRYVAESKEGSNWELINAIYRRTIVIVLGTSALSSATLWLSAEKLARLFSLGELATQTLSLMSWSIVGYSLTWVHSHFFQGLGQIRLFQAFQHLVPVSIFLGIISALTLIMPSASNSAPHYATYFSISQLLSAIIAHLLWRLHYSEFSWTSVADGSISFRKVLLPFMGLLVLQQYSMWGPQVILGGVATPEDISIYSAAVRLAGLTSLVLTGVNSLVFPKFAALHSVQDNEGLQQVAHASTKLMLIACLPFLIVLQLFADRLLLIFGVGFESGSTALRILVIGQFVNVITGSVVGLLNMTGHQHLTFLGSLAAQIILTGLLFILTPLFGLAGAAVAQSAALCFAMLVFTITCKLKLGFAPAEWVVRLK